ncbi:MAG: hypothetical protein IJS58_01365 [Bacilli bacterium]|nr:hypothetical protein [Bacilli bacterium]
MKKTYQGINLLRISLILVMIASFLIIIRFDIVILISEFVSILAFVLELIGIIKLIKQNKRFLAVLILLSISLTLSFSNGSMYTIKYIALNQSFPNKEKFIALLNYLIISFASIVSVITVIINFNIARGLKELSSVDRTKNYAIIIIIINLIVFSIAGIFDVMNVVKDTITLAISSTIFNFIGNLLLLELLSRLKKEYATNLILSRNA